MKVDELEKGPEELMENRELDMKGKSMENGSEGSERKKDKRENKLGNSETKEEYNGIERCSSYKESVKSMKNISTASESFSDREVSTLKKMILEQKKKERKNNIVIKGVKIEGRVEKNG